MRYILKTSAACMPSSCWGVYARIGLLEVDDGVDDVSMISTHARGVRRVVETWEKLHVGTTERCAYQRALREAEALCDRLNHKAK